ncbi:MAG: hypothetical protein IJ292_05395 [Clostridia bacterium]|nr:hypothetical protein [Clostridia bacterium]
MKKYINKKSVIIASVMLLLLVAVGTTLAYIFTETEPVENTFNPSKVSCAVVEDGYEPVSGKIQNISDKKSNVQIKNTGDTDAYIRVAVVVNWMDEAGTKVWATKPVEDTDYSITYANTTNWVKGSDDYWYYTKSVPPTDGNNLTDILIEKATQNKEGPKGTDGTQYCLSIEIVASAIQSTPETVVEKHWGVTVENGVIKEG